MKELLFRVATVTRSGNDLELIAGQWGNGELELGQVVELHRPDGIVILAPINSVSSSSGYVTLQDLASFELVPVGTEIRVPGPRPASGPRITLKRKAGDKIDRGQLLGCSFPQTGERGSLLSSREPRGEVVVWFPMHVILARIRRELEKHARWVENAASQKTTKAAEDLNEWTAAYQRLEEVANTDAERHLWPGKYGDFVVWQAGAFVMQRKFTCLVCPDCAAEYRPDELHLHHWTVGSCGGEILRCPQKHPLAEVKSWMT